MSCCFEHVTIICSRRLLFSVTSTRSIDLQTLDGLGLLAHLGNPALALALLFILTMVSTYN